MQALKLIQENNCEIDFHIGKEIGFGGADGQVFNIINHPAQVVKFSVLYENFVPLEQDILRIEEVLQFIKTISPPAYSNVYNYKKLLISSRKTVLGTQRYVLYYYIMDKCLKISDDEKKVFHSILSHEDRAIEKNFSHKKIKELLKGLSMGLDFDEDKILNFCDQIISTPINHNDVHPRNIMKNQSGLFKLTDFDRAQLKDNKKYSTHLSRWWSTNS